MSFAIVTPTLQQIQGWIQGFNQGEQATITREANFASYFSSSGTYYPGAPYLQNGLSAITIDNTNSNGLYLGNGVSFVAVPNPAVAGQQVATFTLAWGVGTLTLGSGGTGGTYAVNDILTLATSGATIKVASVSSGVILTWTLLTPGTGAVIASAVTTTGGGGTGATFNVTGLNPVTATIVLAGAGYGNLTPPVVTLTDSTGGGSILTAVLANTDNILNLSPAKVTQLSAAANDLNWHSLVSQGLAIVMYGDSKTVTGATNAAPIVLTIPSATGLGIGEALVVSGVTPSAYNGQYVITALTGTTVTLNNGSPPGSAYVSGGTMTIENNFPIVATGYNFLANLAAAAGVGL